MLADPHPPGVLEAGVARKLLLGVLPLQVAEDDDRLRKADCVRDRLKPLRLGDGIGCAGVTFDVHGLDDVRAVELLQQAVDAPIDAEHLVVAEALVVPDRPRIPEPAIGEPSELPQVMVRLDEWDAPVDLRRYPLFVRTARRFAHAPPGRSGSDGCAASG